MKEEFGCISLFRAEKKNLLRWVFSLVITKKTTSKMASSFASLSEKKNSSSSGNAYETAEEAYGCTLSHIKILYES